MVKGTMKKTLIILLTLMMAMATACGGTSDNSISSSQGALTSENVTSENRNENEREDGNETENESEDVDEEDENEENGGNVVKPITGGGNFTPSDDY